MRKLWLSLGVLCLAASAAIAGPNAGGVLWVHDIGIYESDVPPPPVSVPPADCADVDNQFPLASGPAATWIWKVYAAFPQTSSPRLLSTAWGIQFPEWGQTPYGYVRTMLGGAPDVNGAGTDIWTGANGFPTASGGEVEQSFPTGPRTSTVVELFYFGGWGYGYAVDSLQWSTVAHGDPAKRFFVDDAVPAQRDPIMGYGSLGFGVPGYTPCPVAPDPTGACCDTATGACTITTQAECPFAWLGEGAPCNDATCMGQVPAERSSWGKVKSLFRHPG